MPIIRISSIDDERLDVFARLTEHQLRNRLEQEKAIMIAETRLVVETALAHGMEPRAFLLDERHLESMAQLLETVDEQVPIYVAPRDVLTQITGFTVTRGIMAALRRPVPAPPSKVFAQATRIAVLEGLVDATNVGALLRSAAALGVQGLLLDPSCADPFSRRAARVSMGCAYTLPWARFSKDAWPSSAFAQLKDAGFHTIALALTEDARPLDDPALNEHDRLALVFGSEGWGLSQATQNACDETVIIPMADGVDSLNVAAASAVVFWQLRRRREPLASLSA